MCDVCPPLERHERQQETDGQRGVSSVLLKACKGCGRLIPQALTMCEQCEARQQSRHVTYNNTRRDPRAAEFYLSKEWRELRPVIMSVYEYVDIYALYVEHKLITLKDSDPIHHIIELEEDWEQRLNPLNLIPLSHRTHNTKDCKAKRTSCEKHHVRQNSEIGRHQIIRQRFRFKVIRDITCSGQHTDGSSQNERHRSNSRCRMGKVGQ